MLLARFRFRFSSILGFRLQQKKKVRNLKGLDAVSKYCGLAVHVLFSTLSDSYLNSTIRRCRLCPFSV